MTDVLARIAAYKREDVAARRKALSQDAIEARARQASAPRGFRRALARHVEETGRPALIAEIKKASPSKGLIREVFDPPALARDYERGGASCLSVLTDGPSFQGEDAFLFAAREATALPCLRKDFLIDPWQVAESRALGADCILIILAMVDDDAFGDALPLSHPVPAMQRVSRDLTLAEPLALADGRSMTALEIQWELLARARRYAEQVGLEAVGEEVGKQVLDRWESVLAGLERDPSTLAGQLDWVAKLRLFDGYRERHGLEWSDPRLAAMDLQYHDLRPGKSLASRLDLERLVDTDEVLRAVHAPPEHTRAYFRGRCLERFADDIVSANWDSVVFDVGGPSLQRVPMLEPSRGTAETVGELIDSAASAADLIERLRGDAGPGMRR